MEELGRLGELLCPPASPSCLLGHRAPGVVHVGLSLEPSPVVQRPASAAAGQEVQTPAQLPVRCLPSPRVSAWDNFAPFSYKKHAHTHKKKIGQGGAQPEQLASISAGGERRCLEKLRIEPGSISSCCGLGGEVVARSRGCGQRPSCPSCPSCPSLCQKRARARTATCPELTGGKPGG